MKKRNILKFLLIFIGIMVINVSNVNAACKGVDIYGNNSKVVLGETEDFLGNLLGCTDAGKKIDWYVEKESRNIVEFVSANGLCETSDGYSSKCAANAAIRIKGKAVGTAYIKACVGDETDKCDRVPLIVTGTKCKGIEIWGQKGKIEVNGKDSMHVEFDGCWDPNSNVDWYVDENSKIISLGNAGSGTISKDGKSATNVKASGYITIQGLKNGKTNITACFHGHKPSDNDSMCAGYTMAIGTGTETEVKRIDIDTSYGGTSTTVGTNLSLGALYSFNGMHVVEAKTGEEDEIDWTSSNDNVAIVAPAINSAMATVTPVSAGQVTIKACLVKYQNICSSVKITVKEKSTNTVEENEVLGLKYEKSSVTVPVKGNVTVNINYTEKNQSKILDEDGITLVSYITENGKTTGDGINKSTISASECLQVSASKNEIVLTATKQCATDLTVKTCLSTRKDVCTQNLSVTVAGTVNDHINSDGVNKTKAEFIAKNYNLTYNETATFDCEGLLDANLVAVIKKVMQIIRIAVPIILILMVTVDFSRVVIEQDKDSMPKAISRAIKRGIAAIVIFFIPLLVNVILDMPGISEHTDSDCSTVLE